MIIILNNNDTNNDDDIDRPTNNNSENNDCNNYYNYENDNAIITHTHIYILINYDIYKNNNCLHI